jgi:mitochondrial fission protein ELM1
LVPESVGASAPSGPSIWVVSDGRAGIERQALSLERALREPERWAKLAHIRSDAYRAEPVRLQPSGPQLLLPVDKWPAPLNALPGEQRALLQPPWPDVWIASGRRSIPFSRQVKKWSNGKTLVVQTQDPKVDLAPFDLVIPPLHDELKGPNVFPILGPPTYFAAADIAEAEERFSDLTAHSDFKLLVSIGGNSRTHKMSGARVAEIENVLKRLAKNGYRLWITVSRRTPEAARAWFRAFAGDVGARFWESPEKDGPNPYLGFLVHCDAVLVTEDSANMLADPAWFGKPIHILRLEGGSPRFDRLHQGFIDRGAARWFEGLIDEWEYPPIREAERAADEIVRLLLERHPAPA